MNTARSDRRRPAHQRQAGVALLAVLWLSMALTLIAMTTAFLVRTEARATANQIEAVQAELLARGAVQATLYNLQYPVAEPAEAPAAATLRQAVQPGQRWMRFEMERGTALVEIVPENAKLNVNTAPEEQLAGLFLLLGVPENESRELAAAIVDWRTPRLSSVDTPFDVFYAGLPQPYAARHGALEELEELLAVKGMTRDLFYGRLLENPDGTLRRTPPLADLLTTEPVLGGINVNFAAYEVLRVLPGWSEELAAAVLQARSQGGPGTLLERVPGLSAAASLSGATVAPGLAYSLTATAQMRDSQVRRTVRARIRRERPAARGFQITGWWEDWPWSAAPVSEFEREGKEP